jgi:hypothetical protein
MAAEARMVPDLLYYVLPAVVAAAALYICWIFERVVRIALRTGRLQAGGLVYDRTATPRPYWGLLAGMAVVALMLCVSVAALIMGAYLASA